jgi:hypothetical protein
MQTNETPSRIMQSSRVFRHFKNDYPNAMTREFQRSFCTTIHARPLSCNAFNGLVWFGFVFIPNHSISPVKLYFQSDPHLAAGAKAVADAQSARRTRDCFIMAMYRMVFLLYTTEVSLQQAS